MILLNFDNTRVKIDLDAIDREDLIYLEPLPLFNPDGTVMG